VILYHFFGVSYHFLLVCVTEHNISRFLHCFKISLKNSCLSNHSNILQSILYSKALHFFFYLPCIYIIQKFFIKIKEIRHTATHI
jgi:hypothetical protein